MPKIEFTPVFDFQKFNFLGKRLFDFINGKLHATTRTYIGNGATQNIFIDINPRFILIVGHNDGDSPVFWVDTFPAGLAKDFDGTNYANAIISISPKRDFFTIGSNILVNELNTQYTFIIVGE